MIQNSKNDRDDPCVTCQNKDEVIFNNITIDKKIELLPYISSNISGTSDSGEEKLNYQKLKTDVGIGINVELSKNLSLELTINPDFSQIEADVTKIDINSSYTLIYPEKRPIIFQKKIDKAVPKSPILTNEEIISIKKSETAQKNIKKSAEWFLEFLSRNSYWICQNSHNHLRITRAIKSLRFIHSNEEAEKFKNSIMNLIQGKISLINPKENKYWKLILIYLLILRVLIIF